MTADPWRRLAAAVLLVPVATLVAFGVQQVVVQLVAEQRFIIAQMESYIAGNMA